MNIFDQPFEKPLGYELIKKLHSNEYSDFYFIVAYAKTSGVNRLLPSMRKFKDFGGKIKAVVGIDQKNTSYEALVSLNDICDELYIYHSQEIMRTFHVKAYCFIGNNTWISVGSNNLTSGGLFNNYEACACANIDNSQNKEFISMFDRYSDPESPCCKKADIDFINTLLAKGYIEREKTLARQHIITTSHSYKRSKEDRLFGRDIIEKASLSAITTKPKQSGKKQHTKGAQKNENQIVSTPIFDEGVYLIRHVPKAGSRSKQVHFTMDILKNYFKLHPGDELKLQQLGDIFTPKRIEERKVVLSTRNQNVKIEVGAAEILDNNYPTDASKRPILVFKRINPTFFEYMLLLDGDPGYNELNKRLLDLNWTHKSLPYEVIDAGTMLDLWDACPMV